MNNFLFVEAIKNGEYISIDNFSAGIGRECNCICPECGEPVCSNVTNKMAKDLKIKFTNHFSHINKTDCTGGYKETELHLFAKAVIEKNSSIRVPGVKFHFPDTLQYSDVILEKAFPIEKYKQYRPDIIITGIKCGKIAIEIIVTNPLSTTKAQLFKDAEFKCLTINLSGYQKKEIHSIKVQIENDIIKKTDDIKKWIWPILIQDVDNIGELYSVKKQNSNPIKDSGCLLLFGIMFLLIAVFISLNS